MGTHGCPWGLMGTFGDPWGPLGASRDLWGPMGSFGDLWGLTGTYGDIWGHMGAFCAFWLFSFFAAFPCCLDLSQPLYFFIFFSVGGGINFLHTRFDTPPLPPSITPISDTSHILLYTVQTQHATSDIRHQTLYTTVMFSFVCVGQRALRGSVNMMLLIVWCDAFSAFGGMPLAGHLRLCGSTGPTFGGAFPSTVCRN